MRFRALAKEIVYGALYASGASAIRRSRLGRHVAIFTYHSFSASAHGALGDSLPARRFESQLSYLKRNYDVVGLDAALRWLDDEAGAGRDDDRRPLAVVSVDDGFADNFTVMRPVVLASGLPVTVFLATDFLDSGRAPWPTQLAAIVRQARVDRITFPFSASLGSPGERSAAAARMKREWKRLDPDARFDALAELARHVGIDSVRTPPALTWAQVREMRRDGIAFGSHTVYHSLLPFVSTEAARRELVESKKRMENELDEPCAWLAYPNGDHDSAVVTLAREAGYRAALTQDAGVNRKGQDLLALRRIQVPHDESMACFAYRAAPRPVDDGAQRPIQG